MIEISHYRKTFHLKKKDVVALDDVSLSVREGEIFGVIGYSGAGKSTLVRCINFLEVPDSGRLSIDGFGTFDIKDGRIFHDGRAVGGKDLARLRRSIGMIFQHFNLFDRSTVFENTAYPLRHTGLSERAIEDRVRQLLSLVGLSDKIDAYPSQLSGGQKQRVAIARALANNPKILLSDEATSALDPDATESILRLLKDLNAKLGLTIIIITHEMGVIKSVCDRVAVLENGRKVEEDSVYRIFSDPRQPITRRFVDATSSMGKVDELIRSGHAALALKPGERLYKLVFGRNTFDPLISQASRQFKVGCDILLADIETIGPDGIGSMIVKFIGEPGDVEGAKAFLRAKQVRIEEVVCNS